MNNVKIRTFVLLVITNVFFTFSQQKEISYRVETFGSVATGKNTPFWMLNHTWGMVPLKADNFYVRGGLFHNREMNKDWNFSLGADIAASSPHAYGTVWIQQLYGELNWKFLRLNVGSKEDYTSLLDENLSSGDFDLSNNARPMPEIKVSLPDFILVPYTKGNFYIKGDFSVGKYLDSDYLENVAAPHAFNYVRGVLAHHKSVYFRFGDIKTKNKLQFILGMDNQAQWGGTLYKDGNVIPMVHSFSDFLRVVFASEGSSRSKEADRQYIAGSQIGSYLFKWDYLLKNKDILSLYWHHFFDDGSGMAMESYPDMLLGLQYKTSGKRMISGALFEYVYTKNQTGPVHFNIMMDDAHSSIKNKGNGNDDYYNNVDYIQGRSYYGRSLGTPLFLSPEYNGDGRLYFKSNRILAFHTGIEGFLTPKISYLFLATYGETWGSYSVPYVQTKKGFATALDIIYQYPRLEGLNFKLSAGFNTGEFFGENTFGTGITISKRGIIDWNKK